MEKALYARHAKKIRWSNDLSECPESVSPTVRSLARKVAAHVPFPVRVGRPNWNNRRNEEEADVRTDLR